MFPAISDDALKELERHNCHFREAWKRHCDYAPQPWWHRHGVIDSETRFQYQSWIPVEDFLRSIVRIGRAFLPSTKWLPRLLQKDFPSMPDFWAVLPEAFCNRAAFQQEELLTLFCAMADPPRFGTDCDRYPQQIKVFSDCIADKKTPTVIDIGCGVGLYTYQLAAAIPDGHFIGITAEPLEVWMATNRILPHDVVRSRHFERFANINNVEFQTGDASNLELPHADAIVCNGLIGGRFFNTTTQYAALISQINKALPIGGGFFCASNFHDGCKNNVEQFMRLLQNNGYSIEGAWRSFAAKKRKSIFLSACLL